MKVSVSGKQFIFPRSCACCGGYPTARLSVSGPEKNRRARTRGWIWEIPYCTQCKGHIRKSEWIMLGALALSACSMIAGMVVALVFHVWQAGLEIAVGGCVAAGLLANGMLRVLRRFSSTNCCKMGPAMLYLGSDGSCHTFEIYSWFYFSDFVRDNRFKIVNANVEVTSVLRTLGTHHQMARRLLRAGRRSPK